MTPEERKAHQQCIAQILKQNPVSEQLMGLLEKQRREEVLLEQLKREEDRRARTDAYERERYRLSERGKLARERGKLARERALAKLKQSQQRITQRKALTQARDLVGKLERKLHSMRAQSMGVESVVDLLAG